MDTRLLEAAVAGDVQRLYRLIGENPLILHTVGLTSAGNPLHVASAYGQVEFVVEILRLKPDFAKELNQDGFSPMHLASANGQIQIVRELLKTDCQLCHVQGPESRTPLHYAVIKGRIEVVEEILSACGECVKDVTTRKETSLHIAVKNNQFEAIKVLVEMIRHMKKEDVFNLKDVQGNTALHLATWRKQRRVIEMLLGHGLMEVNAKNLSGLTALDMLLILPSEGGDREIEEILHGGGVIRSEDFNLSHTPSSEQSPSTAEGCTSSDFVEYFRFRKGRDPPGETRTALLVVATLVATATYQLAINPPGGIWQENHTPESNNTNTSINRVYAGKSVLGSINPVSFGIFMLFNTIGFSLALSRIYIMTVEFPLQLEIQLCMTAMLTTYGNGVGAVAPDNMRTYMILLTTILPVIAPLRHKGWRKGYKILAKWVVDNIRRALQWMVYMFM